MSDTTTREMAVRPAGVICEVEGAVELRLEMPGVSKDSVDINIEGDTLTVTGKRGEPQDETYLIRERPVGDFQATYTIDERVNRDKIDAKMDRGLLTLTLHLRDEVKPRKIKVATSQ